MFGTQSLLLVSLVFFTVHAVHSAESKVEETRPNTCYESGTELINEDEVFLYLSTLDGTFIGVNHKNGEIKWQFKEEAAVKVPVDSKNALSPIFLPDPRDGSLYLLNSENNSELKKLQFTIQQLVSSSPCRSSDGIFYTGKKNDNWFMVDWRTGWKEELLNVDNTEDVCPLLNRNSMFVGRTEYNLIIYDITRKEMKWNVTFYDYAAKIMPSEKIKNLEYMYFSGSSTGKFAVLKNFGGGTLLWEADFGSPVIGVYLREGDGLISMPFTTMDDNSMPSHDLQFTKQIKLFSTLYIGAHTHGLYALPAYATSPTDLLLNGPSSEDAIPLPNRQESTALLGYHEIPQDGFERLQITGRTDAVIDMNDTGYGSNSSRKSLKNIAIQTEDAKPVNNLKFDRYIMYQLLHIGVDYVISSHNIELKIFMVTILTMMVCMFIYFRAQVREFKQSSSSGFSGISSGPGTVTAIAEELPDGSTRVGKILFNTNLILGKGCEGTFVFKGEFDNRQVAVKRLLPECFTVADREVCLLRESDQHPNVIRYFCMEQDKQFRYIALELCSATLQDYTEKGVLSDMISPTEALAQATAGLEHLHALNIVHRDLKPHNVLLSFPSSSSESRVRAMISDFGLCKKLQIGKASFSRKSGITGTDGWIAPEMIHGRCRTTTAVDIFSMGCVFYYVLSKGKHPFGDSLSRQANIMNGKFKLNELIDDDYELWSHLIAKMVTIDPLERPAIGVIKVHPSFWSKDQSLSFLQDVSDRIEKEDITSKILIELETGNASVLNGDWRDMIEPEIAEDLRKYRSYRADSVRDLLRALRNKKHHYRELSDAVQKTLGSIPDQFVTYWMDRFPKLLLHTWLAMQCVNDENLFHKYYCSAYTFPRINDGSVPCWIQQCVNSSPRWRLVNKNVPKFSNRYAGEKGNSPFFLMSNGDKPQVYTWRQRPKVISELSEVMKSEAGTNEERDEQLDAASELVTVAETVYDHEEDDVLEVEVDEHWNEDEENVKPANVEVNQPGEEVIANGDERWQKNTRHRRGRGRSKKKQANSPGVE